MAATSGTCADLSAVEAARGAAIAAASSIFYRPQQIVDDLIAKFAALPDAQYPGAAAAARACYQQPIRMGATAQVFALRARHWPMLNLLDSAEHQRRSFADAMAVAIAAAREEAAKN